MVNLDYNLTVDDLIVEYMLYKVKNGYDSCFTVSEFIDFLYFFKSKMNVEDILFDGKDLFDRFFDRKSKSDWSNGAHMEMVYIEDKDDYLIKANEKFSCYDESVINTYFMDRMGHKEQVNNIRNVIGEWISTQKNIEIDDSTIVTERDITIGKYVAIEIILCIWDSFIDNHKKSNEWPKQCNDIVKYLLDFDLAEVIELKSIKNDLLELFNVISKRVAIMYHNDNNLQISSCRSNFIPYNNCKLLFEGYENMRDIAFGEYNKSLNINLSNLTFRESHEIEEVCFWDEDAQIKTITTHLENDKIKTLVRKFDCIKK
jgi:hypothetical protein